MKDGKQSGDGKPEDAGWWLPYLPPCGIDKMSITTIILYWSKVMRTVLEDRGKNLGYETAK